MQPSPVHLAPRPPFTIKSIPIPAIWATGVVLASLVFLYFYAMANPELFPSARQSARQEPEETLMDLRMGTSMQEVRERFGPPDNTQQMRSVGSRSDYWYYGSWGNQIQVGFDNGRVTSINRF